MKNKMDSTDAIVATLIALIVILIFVGWRSHLRAKDLDGYWGTIEGDTFHIRVFDKNIVTVAGPKFVWRGKIRPLRTICVGDDKHIRCGNVDLEGRWLTWDTGENWIRQGATR